MAKVYRAKDHNGKPVGPWCGRYQGPLKKRMHVTLYASKLESQKALDELVANGRVQARKVDDRVIDVSELEVVKHAKKPIGPIIEAFIADMNANDETRRLARYRMKKIKSAKVCNLKTVADFAHSAKRFQAHLRTLPGHVGLSTIRQLRGTYSSFGKWCMQVDRGYIVANPADRLEKLKMPAEDARIPHRAFTVAELESLCSSLGGDTDTKGRLLSPKVMRDRRDRAISYRLRAMTGIRETEACRLQVGNINWKEGTLTIPLLASKTRKAKVVLPLPKSVLVHLRERYKGKDPATLLWAKPFHKACLPRDLKRAGIAVVDEAGEVLNVRSFRKSFTSWCVEAGLELLQITMLRRDVGEGSRELIVNPYSDRVSRVKAMRVGVAKLEAWVTAQLAERLTLVG
ncbi:MAG: tyrosine-type recombinase/integrase [Phycisphaerales bacterium]